MFGRVRRGELVLAMTGVAGVLAGLVLTVGTKVGVTGPALIVAGVVVAVAGAAQVIRGQVSGVVARQREQGDRLDAILTVPVQPLAGADPFRIGVFRSVLAQAERGDRAGAGHADAAVPPYVPRG